MKKLLSLILTLVLALVLVGCNEADKNNPSLTNGGETFISLTGMPLILRSPVRRKSIRLRLMFPA